MPCKRLSAHYPTLILWALPTKYLGTLSLDPWDLAEQIRIQLPYALLKTGLSSYAGHPPLMHLCLYSQPCQPSFLPVC